MMTVNIQSSNIDIHWDYELFEDAKYVFVTSGWYRDGDV